MADDCLPITPTWKLAGLALDDLIGKRDEDLFPPAIARASTPRMIGR